MTILNKTHAPASAILLTIEQVQEELQLTRSAVFTLMSERQLLRVKIGRATRIPRASMDEYVTALIERARDRATAA